MLSMPPATMASASPARMAWAASATAFMPDAQTLLMVKTLVSCGTPALILACRPVFCPRPDCRTLPMMTSSM